jgi:hypothetical protein
MSSPLPVNQSYRFGALQECLKALLVVNQVALDDKNRQDIEIGKMVVQ